MANYRKKIKIAPNQYVSESGVLEEYQTYTHPGKIDDYGTSPYCEFPLRTWLYKNPFSDEELPEGVFLDPRVIVINNIPFQARSDCQYKRNPYEVADQVITYKKYTAQEKLNNPLHHELNVYRNEMQRNLWFLVYFASKNTLANHPFVVNACKEIQSEKGDTLEVWAREHLKAVDLNEPVPTPDGWKKHGDLKVGDRVYSPDGSECSIVGVSNVFTTGDCYRVTFTDGNSVVVNGDHLWTVEKKSRRRIKGTKNQRQTRESLILNTRELSKFNHEADSRFSLPSTKPLICNEVELPISPYVLGAWLGDGTSENGAMTCGDIEIWREVEKEGFEISAGRPSYPITRTIYKLQPKLRALGLLKNKHIPVVYLRASIEQRLALLQGLMDTDGTCNSRGTASFTNKNKFLAEQVYELCASLGLNPKFYTYDLHHGLTYFVAFQGYQELPVFRLKRKLSKCFVGSRKNNRKFILSVEEVPTIPTSCVKVDREDGLYLIGKAMIPTHNTTVISTCRQIQKVLNDQDKTIAIISATRPLAVSILSGIRRILEDKFVTQCFPDILYQDANREAWKWSEAPEGGLFVKRKNSNAKEPTFSAWGMVQGLPVGFHFTDLVFDDIITQDLTAPDVMSKIKELFDVALNLGSRKTQTTVIGTFYHHDDPLVYVASKIDIDTGLPLFPMRKKPASDTGEKDGRPVFLTQKAYNQKLSGNQYIFYCQQLLNPTPKGSEKLNYRHLITVKKGQLPENLYKFMLIDGAGDKGKRNDHKKSDAWAMAVIGVEPHKDDAGLSRIFILDLLIKEMDLATAQNAAVEMYCRNGRILRLGIEKVAMSTTEIHIASALAARRKFVSVEMGNLQIMQPRGRQKAFRIESALALPLKHGKVHILDTVEYESRDRLYTEMEKFPSWKDDGLDAISYVYDMIKEYRFGSQEFTSVLRDRWDEAFEKAKRGRNMTGWIAV